jgi:hypothetical protein
LRHFTLSPFTIILSAVYCVLEIFADLL